MGIQTFFSEKALKTRIVHKSLLLQATLRAKNVKMAFFLSRNLEMSSNLDSTPGVNYIPVLYDRNMFMPN